MRVSLWPLRVPAHVSRRRESDCESVIYRSLCAHQRRPDSPTQNAVDAAKIVVDDACRRALARSPIRLARAFAPWPERSIAAFDLLLPAYRAGRRRLRDLGFK